MRCRGGWEHLKPVLTPETLPCETPVFLMHIGAVDGDSSQLESVERVGKEGPGPPLLLAPWAGSASLWSVWLGAVSEVVGSWSMTK